MHWYQKAAEQGDDRAQRSLGARYSLGLGVPKDDVKAARWIEKSAEQGNKSAQNNLGGRYAFGLGVPQDYAKAALWWEKAAAQGVADSQFALGVMYIDGRGVPQDQQKGCGLIRASADQGHKTAINVYNDFCVTGADTSQADLKKRLDDEIARLVKSAKELGAVR